MTEKETRKKAVPPQEKPVELPHPKGPISRETLVAFIENAKRLHWTSLKDLLGISKESLSRLPMFTLQAADELTRAIDEFKEAKKKISGTYRLSPAVITIGKDEHRVIRIQKNSADLGFAPIPSLFANDIIAEGFTGTPIYPNGFEKAVRLDPRITGEREAMEILNANLDVIGAIFGPYKEVKKEKGWIYKLEPRNATAGKRPRVRKF